MPHFQIIPTPSNDARRWHYVQGSVENPGDVICTSGRTFPNETAVRSHIASTKKTFAAARTAKVVTKETP
jgi:hypothetical protein